MADGYASMASLPYHDVPLSPNALQAETDVGEASMDSRSGTIRQAALANGAVGAGAATASGSVSDGPSATGSVVPRKEQPLLEASLAPSRQRKLSSGSVGGGGGAPAVTGSLRNPSEDSQGPSRASLSRGSSSSDLEGSTRPDSRSMKRLSSLVQPIAGSAAAPVVTSTSTSHRDDELATSATLSTARSDASTGKSHRSSTDAAAARSRDGDTKGPRAAGSHAAGSAASNTTSSSGRAGAASGRQDGEGQRAGAGPRQPPGVAAKRALEPEGSRGNGNGSAGLSGASAASGGGGGGGGAAAAAAGVSGGEPPAAKTTRPLPARTGGAAPGGPVAPAARNGAPNSSAAAAGSGRSAAPAATASTAANPAATATAPTGAAAGGANGSDAAAGGATGAAAAAGGNTKPDEEKKPRAPVAYAASIEAAQEAFDAYTGVPKLYEILKPIGCGAYGAVYLARNPVTREKVALKQIINAFTSLTDARRIFREIKVMKHFAHPHIVKLLHVIRPANVKTFEHIYLVSELMETDLHRVIHSRQDLTSEHISYFLYQVGAAS